MTIKRHTVHIRRNDEVNLTHCGRMTELDMPMNTKSAIKMNNPDEGLAIFDNIDWPSNTTQCSACNKAYDAEQDAFSERWARNTELQD